jgi:hypothetical protein
MPNNPDPLPASIKKFPQQLIVAITNILPTIDAPTFVDPLGEFFRVLELEFSVKIFLKKIIAPTISSRRMKPSRCSVGGFSSLKTIFRASQT